MNRRDTSQRRAIRDVFAAEDRPLSTEEVLAGAQRHKPGLGIATVYRTIKLLVDEHWVAPVQLPGQPPRYERAGKPRHHHFCCRVCGRVYEVPDSVKLTIAAVPKGFTLDYHDVVLYGRCAGCHARPPS